MDTNNYSFKTPAEGAKLFGCSVSNYRAQLVKNRSGILSMLQKARAKGKSVNGYTESNLEQMVLAYNRAISA